jgi:hypothetical protein
MGHMLLFFIAKVDQRRKGSLSYRLPFSKKKARKAIDIDGSHFW